MRFRRVLISAAATLLTAAAGGAHAASSVTFDYATSNGIGYPGNFGGGINKMSNLSDYDTIKDHGATWIRHDLYLGRIVPPFVPGTNTPATVARYLANEGGLADPVNWNFSDSDSRIDPAVDKGFQVMLIMSYNVPWLSVNPAVNGHRGVPTNGTVYMDIVSKVFDRYKDKVTAVEIWNEPDNLKPSGDGYFLSLAGDSRYNGGASPSDFLTAYKDIYYAASLAIRSVSATVPIGGPVSFDHGLTLQNWVTSMLADSRIADEIDFLSYHAYGLPDGEPSVAALRSIAASYGKPNIPVLITEWNLGNSTNPINDASEDAIPYVAFRLTDMIYAHANGNAIFRFHRDGDFNETKYFSIHADGTPTKKLRVYRLLAKQLGLNAGQFQLRGRSTVNGAAVLSAGAAVNSAGERVAWVTNAHANNSDTLNVSITGLQPSTSYTITRYEASPANEAKVPVSTFTATSTASGTGALTLTIPAKSVLGFKFIPN